jgi:tight adherence protein C
MLALIVILVFSSLALGVMSLYYVFARPANTVNTRLESMDPSLALVENNPLTVMAERVADPINKIIPISAIEAAKIQKQLMQAGYRDPEAATAFRAIQITMLIALPTIVSIVCFLMKRPLMSFVVWGMFGLALGFYLPKYVLWKKTLARKQRITWALADAMDLMVVTVEAGLGLNAALNRVGAELKDLHPDMYNELEMVNLEIRVGRSREEALRNLSERTGVDDIRSFVALLIQADRFGSSIAVAVRVFADSLRTKRRQRAEQAAAKASLKLLFPLTCFLFPVIIMVILAPSLFNLMDLLFN